MTVTSTKTPSFKLNTGALLPAIGLGTWKSSEEDAYTAVLSALNAGYKHIDTAAIYRNERAVGKAIRDSGIPRDELFITTKLWSTQHRDPKAALDGSLERLGLDYVDLYLIHYPVAFKTDRIEDGNPFCFPLLPNGKRDLDIVDWDFVKTWRLVQHLPESGKCKAVGVSNFSINNLKTLLESDEKFAVPAVNQVEIHPQLPQTELIDFCKSKDIVVEAYSPLGSTGSQMLTDDTLQKIAEKYDAQPAQILINWGISRGYCVLPKSVTPKRIEANARIIDIKKEDLLKVTNLIDILGPKRYLEPDWSPFPIFE